LGFASLFVTAIFRDRSGTEYTHQVQANNSLPSSDSASQFSSLADYQESPHWQLMINKLNELQNDDFKVESLPQLKHGTISIPIVNGEPSLLLYGLTAKNRYNGTAAALSRKLETLQSWLFLQAVSGAGKTRAILDVFANFSNTAVRTPLYFDFSRLAQGGEIPAKNFNQVDVATFGRRLLSQTPDRAGAKKLVEALIAARYIVTSYLKEKGWDSESLLFAQLGIHGATGPCNVASEVFLKLAGQGGLEGYDTLVSSTIVSIDESNVALDMKLGRFKSGAAEREEEERPLLCCVGDALHGWKCIFSGTSFSHDQFDKALISNTAGSRTPLFSSITKMENVQCVKNMIARFKIKVEDTSMNTLESLTGRCRLVSRAITAVLIYIESGQETVRTVEDIFLEYIENVRRDLTEQMKKRISKDLASKALIEEIFVATLLNKPKEYASLTEAGKGWADESFVWVSGSSQSLELNEPILVRAARDAYGAGWDPVTWLINRAYQASPAQAGFDFEQIAARKVATALGNETLEIKDENGVVQEVKRVLDAQIATTVVASKFETLDGFLENPQTTTIFLPANKDGPDAVFWALCSNGRWCIVLIQAKYYSKAITGGKTLDAYKTLWKPQIPDRLFVLRIFFPFMGATCSSDPDVFKNRFDEKGGYIYLDKDNAGNCVLGADVREKLLNIKKRKNAPTVDLDSVAANPTVGSFSD
jgi:hypothetical protein